MGLLDEMEGDSNSSLEVPNDSGLGAVAKLAEKIIAQEQHVKQLELELKGAKATLLKLTDEDLPSAMQELNLFYVQFARRVQSHHKADLRRAHQ